MVECGEGRGRGGGEGDISISPRLKGECSGTVAWLEDVKLVLWYSFM